MFLLSNGQFVGGNLLRHAQPSLAQPGQRVKEEYGTYKGGNEAPEQVGTSNVRKFMPKDHRPFGGIQPTPCFRWNHNGRPKYANDHRAAAAREFEKFRVGSQTEQPSIDCQLFEHRNVLDGMASPSQTPNCAPCD
jgi:hypothetical protein